MSGEFAKHRFAPASARADAAARGEWSFPSRVASFANYAADRPPSLTPTAAPEGCRSWRRGSAQALPRNPAMTPQGFDDMRSRTRPRGAAEQRSERTEPPTLHSFAGAGASGGSRLRRCEERLRCPISTRSSRLAYGPISSKRDPQEKFNEPLPIPNQYETGPCHAIMQVLMVGIKFRP